MSKELIAGRRRGGERTGQGGEGRPVLAPHQLLPARYTSTRLAVCLQKCARSCKHYLYSSSRSQQQYIPVRASQVIIGDHVACFKEYRTYTKRLHLGDTMTGATSTSNAAAVLIILLQLLYPRVDKHTANAYSTFPLQRQGSTKQQVGGSPLLPLQAREPTGRG